MGVPDRTLSFHRRIWADDPDDLNSPLHYSVTVTEADDGEEEAAPTSEVKRTPACRKVIEALRDAPAPETVKQLSDRIAGRHGQGLKRETVSRELNKLAAAERLVPVARSSGAAVGRPASSGADWWARGAA